MGCRHSPYISEETTTATPVSIKTAANEVTTETTTTEHNPWTSEDVHTSDDATPASRDNLQSTANEVTYETITTKQNSEDAIPATSVEQKSAGKWVNTKITPTEPEAEPPVLPIIPPRLTFLESNLTISFFQYGDEPNSSRGVPLDVPLSSTEPVWDREPFSPLSVSPILEVTMTDKSSYYDDELPQKISAQFIRPHSSDALNLRKERLLRANNAHTSIDETSLGLSSPSRIHAFCSPLRRAATTASHSQTTSRPLQRRRREQAYRTRNKKRESSIFSPTSTIEPIQESPSPRISNAQYVRQTVKPDCVTEFLRNALVKSKLFKRVDCDEVARNAISETIREMYTHDLSEGEILVKQGDEGKAFFIVEYGALDVIIEQTDPAGKKIIRKVASMGSGKTVGEASLMYNITRNATLKANRPTRIWVMDRNQFHRIRDLIQGLTLKKQKEFERLLKKIPMFGRKKPFELSTLAQACDEVEFNEDEVIASKMKNSINHMYIIQEGKVKISRGRSSSMSISHDVELGQAEYFFGQEFKNEPIKIVRAMSKVKCIRIRKQDYDKLVEPYFNMEDSSSWSEEEESLSEVELPREFKRRVSWELDDLEPFAIAGSGSFGDVLLVRAGKGEKKEVFALKVVEKKEAINKKQGEHLKNERRVMFLLDSPFIVKLYATYKDEAYVYFLTEKVLGGELFLLMKKRVRLSEAMSRFYTGCVTLALQHIHSYNIIYRDLKPENILVSAMGYLKLTDFGFATLRNRSTSLCGTPEYLAPELLTGDIQNFAVDWWCLGILLFEMLVGRVPFCDTEHMKLHMHVMTSTVEVPDTLSWEAQEIIRKLLMKRPFQRLGSGRRGARDIQQEPWFELELKDDVAAFDWEKLTSCKLKAPYEPPLSSDEDHTHFEQSLRKRVPTNEQTDDNTFCYSLYEWCEEF